MWILKTVRPASLVSDKLPVCGVFRNFLARLAPDCTFPLTPYIDRNRPLLANADQPSEWMCAAGTKNFKLGEPNRKAVYPSRVCFRPGYDTGRERRPEEVER